MSIWLRSIKGFALVIGLFPFIACDRQDALNANAGPGSPSSSTPWVAPDPATITVVEEAKLTSPPEVPPAIARKHPARVVVKIEVKELVMPLADGVDYTFWTFGGTVPGSFIRVRRGDIVEVRLANHPDNKVPHNIDLHAATGPGGGAVSSFTPPGKESTFSFQALNPGLYVYHCATAPVGMHIANGMYGLILVEPEEGFAPVDREFYVMQGDFYTKGKFGEEGLQPFDMEKALREQPDYVVFNGSVNALLGENKLHAKKGERVRLYMGNGGPSLVSSFHAIGEIFDTVYVEGGTFQNHNVQTTLVPAGGAVIVDMKLEAPGEIILVDHSIFRAFNKGALAMMEVEGTEEKGIYSGQTRQDVYLPEGATVQAMPNEIVPKVAPPKDVAEQFARGGRVYQRTCAACHLPDGAGLEGAFPPLAASDYLNADVNRAIVTVDRGLSGEITVNGKVYASVMPRLNLTHAEIADVLTFVYGSWGNEAKRISEADVAKVLGGGS